MENIGIVIVGILSAIFFFLFGKGRERKINRSNLPERITKWEPQVRAWSNQYGVPFDVAMSVLWTESSGDPGARGSNGEYGLYQLKQIAITDLEQMGYGNFTGWKFDPEVNIKAGLSFLALQKRRTGSWAEAVKAYNQGQAGAQRYPERAQAYLDKVKSKQKFF